VTRGSFDGVGSGFRLEERTEIEEIDVVEPLLKDLLEAEVRVEVPGEIVVPPSFRAESLEDFRVVNNVEGTLSTSFLADPRSETGVEELDKLDMGEDERVEEAGSVVLREKYSVSFLVCFWATFAVLVDLFETIAAVVVGDGG